MGQNESSLFKNSVQKEVIFLLQTQSTYFETLQLTTNPRCLLEVAVCRYTPSELTPNTAMCKPYPSGACEQAQFHGGIPEITMDWE